MFNNKFKYLVGIISSQLGSAIQSVAIPLLVLDMTKSASIMSILFSLGMIAKIISFPIAGVICDKYNKKQIMVISDLVSGSIILICALLAFTNILSIQALFVMQIVTSFVSGIFQTASSSIVPNIIDNKELLKVNTIKNLVINGVYIAGPVIGGFLYGFFNIKIIFLINGLSFIVSAIIEMFIVYENSLTQEDEIKLDNSSEKIDKKGYFTLVKSFVNGDKQIGYMVLLVLILNFLVTPLFSALYPAMYRIDLNFTSSQYGVINSTLTVGLLFTSTLLLKRFNLEKLSNINKYIFKGILAYGVGVLLSGLLYFLNFIDINLLFGLQLVSMFIIGMGAPIFDICIDTYIQEKCDKDKLGKVFAFLDFIGNILSPFSVFFFGILADVVSAHILLIIIGSILLFVSLWHRKMSDILTKM